MRALKSVKGRDLGLDSDGTLVVPRGGLALGDHGNQFEMNSPKRLVVFDDFLGDTLNADLYSNPTKGSDAATVDFAVLAAQQSGFLRGTFGANAGASMATNGIAINGALQWKANQTAHPRRLVLEARVRLSAITNINAFIGFTDQIAALEAPFTIAGGDAFTSNASDAVGFVFDTTAATDRWWLAGVKTDVDVAHQLTAFAPVAATFETFRIEVAPDGSAVFFRNGKQVGVRMANAVAVAISLAPCVTGFTQSAASATCDIDYVHVAADRV